MSSSKLWKSKIVKISRFLVIFAIITAWIFGGWPQVYNFPPEVKVTQRAPAIPLIDLPNFDDV